MAYPSSQKTIRLILDKAPERGQTLAMNNPYTISYDTDDAFYKGVKFFLESGIHFEANHAKMEIVLTGAF